jgi:hypothetical protein
VFPHVAVSAPQDYLDLVRSGNFVLVASTQPFDTAALERALPEGEAILFDTDALSWSDGGQILTDEFAPTDQLFQR